MYKAGEVCDLVQVQSYVLRSWEKEFPGIGVQRSPESPRLYSQSDLEHVQRIKQLVFGEGLTVAGARRRLEESAPAARSTAAADAAEMLEALGADARSRIARVRDGLLEIRALLSGVPGSSNGSSFTLKPPSAAASHVKARPAPARVKAVKPGAAVKASVGRTTTSAIKRKRGR